MIKVVFDACVLYSAPLRGFLLSLATAKLVEPFWSDEIQNEWTRSVSRNRPVLERHTLESTCQKMDAHFPNALVQGYESLIPTLVLPDPNDRHVLAAAIHVEADSIVTFNLSDFPKKALQPYGIEALPPEEFVLRLIQQRPERVIKVARDHRSSLKNPPKTADEYLATLEKQGLPKTVAFLREHNDNI